MRVRGTRSRSAPALAAVVACTVALFVGWTTPGPVGAQQRSVVVVGDSIILGAESTMTRAFTDLGWVVSFDAQVNRSTSVGGDVINARAGELTDTLVVNLGANDAGNTGAYRSRVDQILASTASVPHVYWLTIREVRDYYPAANQALRDAAAAYPNVTVLDWNGATLGRTDLTSSDGLHLNGGGAAAMTDLVVGAAVTGGAPAAPPPVDTTPPPTAAPVVPVAPVTEPPPPPTEAPTTLAPSTSTTTTVAATTTVDRATRERAAADDVALVGQTVDYGNVFSWTFGAGFAVVVGLLAIGGAGIGGWALVGTRGRPVRRDCAPSSPSSRPSPHSSAAVPVESESSV